MKLPQEGQHHYMRSPPSFAGHSASPRRSSIAAPFFRVRARLGWIFTAAFTFHRALAGDIFYETPLNLPIGSTLKEWHSSSIVWTTGVSHKETGSLSPPQVRVTSSPNGHHFLGEFGGPAIGKPGDAGWNATRVDQTITLRLDRLPPHKKVLLSFDLLILKSWDGDSPIYGPDIWTLRQHDGPVIFSSTFSNNPKVLSEGSYQDYPTPHSLPMDGATSRNTLGYRFFGDSTYHFHFTIDHNAGQLLLDFGSSLFEGKGTEDESWGLDNVSVSLEK